MPDVPVPSDAVLDDIAVRALKLLGAISSNPYIRAALALRGYTDATHEVGWSLVLKASGYRRPIAEALARPEAAAAIAEIDAWDDLNFRIARASLVAMPEQASFVFQDLEAQKGAASVASVTTFLDRLDELEEGKDREATRNADQAALEKLAERGIGKDERARLRKLLAVATASPDEAGLAPKVASAKAQAKDAAQREAQIALWAFHTEWSEIAKAVIQRRDHLIQMGLARRKSAKKGTGEEEGGGEK